MLASASPPRLACAACGATRTFVRLPLLCLTGPSGVGKSTAAARAGARLAGRVVTLEQDVLWHPELAERPGGVRDFRRTWLRLAAMVGQSGRPVLLCGTVVPEELEPLPERLLFASISYLALDAPDAVLAARLRARPAWRGWDEARIEEMLAFAAELRGRIGRPAELSGLEVAGDGAEEVAERVVAWATERLDAAGGPGERADRVGGA